jgi:hypothetical protein
MMSNDTISRDEYNLVEHAADVSHDLWRAEKAERERLEIENAQFRRELAELRLELGFARCDIREADRALDLLGVGAENRLVNRIGMLIGGELDSDEHLTVRQFAERVYHNFCGMEQAEVVVFNVDRAQAAMEFIVRALANPRAEGSDIAIGAILKRRQRADHGPEAS